MSYQPAPQSGSYGQAYPESSQATLALILGIVGIFLVQLAAPFAWWLGGKEVKAIEAGRRDPANRGQAKAGQILGLIGTILWILTTLLIIIIFIGGGIAAFSGS
jgi:hypothetical protein